MNTSTPQLELPLATLASTPAEASAPKHLDWPLRPLPTATMHELRRLSTQWGRGQTLRSLRLHGLR